MKKHIVLIMNILLIAAVAVGIFFTVKRAIAPKPDLQPAPTAPAPAAVTEAPTEPVSVPPEERHMVGVVQHANGPTSKACYDGFIAQLEKRGLLEHIDVMRVIESDDEKCIAEIQRLVNEGCDLLYTVGPFASKQASLITDSIPIVFAAVTDPEELGLVMSNEAPGANTTGVSSYTPCFEQIDLIPVLLPGADSVATLYSSTDEEAVRQAIIACMEAEDFSYTADRYPVTDADGIAAALERIREKGTDVIYLPIDDLMIRNLESIVAFCNEHKIPVICGNRNMMSAGCLATCTINYASIGRRCADLCFDILFGKKDPATLPVIYKYDCHNYVNRQSLETLGITLSDVALKNVQIVDTVESAGVSE